MVGQQPPAETCSRASGLAHRWRTPLICLALAVITFAVFGQTLRHGFVNYDDDLYVYDNPHVARGLTWDGVVWALTHAHSANWHPLTWLSHMLDCQLCGLHPGGHHLTNVLLHAATVIALFLVLRQITGAFWQSAFVAAVFAIHPLRVESVAWVAERKDVLSGLFFVLTIGAYFRYTRLEWSPARYGLVLLLFALGLMCKPMLVTLPFVLLLLDYWPLQRKESLGKLIVEKIPLLAFSAAGCAATLWAQNEAVHSGGSFSLPHRLGNALVAGVVYLGQMVWPSGLAALYPFPHDGPPALEVVACGTLLVAFSVVAWRGRRTQPWLLFGWAWYLVMLLPVLGIIQVGRQAHADRYTYLPQIGIYVGLTWLVAGWRVSRAVLAGLATALVAVLMLCAWRQTAYWQDGETLWGRALDCTTDNDVAHNNLGQALCAKGKTEEAIAQFQMALQLRPAYVEARNNLGYALLEKGKADDAIAQFKAALQLKPDFVEAHFNLGNALRQKGRTDEAITQYQEALQLRPAYAMARNNLGTALRQKGRVDEAVTQYQMALEIMPDNEAIQVNLGNALLQKGRADQAILHFQTALQMVPSDMEVLNNLAWLLATFADASLRSGDKAVELARRANALAGGKNAVILGTLAAALAETGQFDEARSSALEAITLAQAAARAELARRLNAQLQLYESGKPYHQP